MFGDSPIYALKMEEALFLLFMPCSLSLELCLFLLWKWQLDNIYKGVNLSYIKLEW